MPCIIMIRSLKIWFLARTALMMKKMMTDLSHSRLTVKFSILRRYFSHRDVREASSRLRILSASLSRVSSIMPVY